jgi:OOP family OmpA-OmpF porin
MKNFLIAFTIFLVWSFFGLWLYSWFQSDTQMADSNTEFAENISVDSSLINSEEIKKQGDGSVTKKNSLLDSINLKNQIPEGVDATRGGLKAINLEGDIIFLFAESISILENSSEIIIPESIIDFKYKTKTYLLEHPDKEVHINSLYSATENFVSPNLGVIRGEKIKEILLSVGIPSDRIVIKPIIKNIDFNEEGLYSNSISFIFKDLNQERVKELKAKLPEPITVYPIFSNTGILENQSLINLLNNVKRLLKQYPGIRIEVIGHTDNIGNDIDNYRMGLNYARQVRQYLITKGGIAYSRVKASSKGEAEPIESNEKASGRIANRRITVEFY